MCFKNFGYSKKFPKTVPKPVLPGRSVARCVPHRATHARPVILTRRDAWESLAAGWPAGLIPTLRSVHFTFNPTCQALLRTQIETGDVYCSGLKVHTRVDKQAPPCITTVKALRHRVTVFPPCECMFYGFIHLSVISQGMHKRFIFKYFQVFTRTDKQAPPRISTSEMIPPRRNRFSSV